MVTDPRKMTLLYSFIETERFDCFSFTIHHFLLVLSPNEDSGQLLDFGVISLITYQLTTGKK